MVSHANRQLEKMTDRYLLIRNEQLPLELNVVDNYQAGEIRSTKNLSGGESFIVSLTLALGLSKMASKKVRVDSLFLDEGFGTLDEEALETALETLSALQNDGKLIGVISHVSSLKERITTQINVSKFIGGKKWVKRSRLFKAIIRKYKKLIFMNSIIFLPSKDSSDISELRKKELNISRSYARELGKTALEAINSGIYENSSGDEVLWGEQIHHCRESKKSISPDVN